jgi:hypothetical protein
VEAVPVTTPSSCNHSRQIFSETATALLTSGFAFAHVAEGLNQCRRKDQPMANNAHTLLSKFRVSDDDLEALPTISDAYHAYCGKRYAYGAAFKDLNEAIRQLHDVLDGPLRSARLVPEGKDWTFKEDYDDGLFIQVWSEPKQRGRRKEEVPLKHLSGKTEEGLGEILADALASKPAPEPPRQTRLRAVGRRGQVDRAIDSGLACERSPRGVSVAAAITANLTHARSETRFQISPERRMVGR